MNKHVVGLLVALTVLSACGSSTPEGEGVTLETLPAATEAPVEETTTTAAETSSTTATTAPTTTSEVVVAASELTWAENGTPEADLERAFWAARNAYEDASRSVPIDPAFPTLIATYSGVELEQTVSFLTGLANSNVRVSDSRPSRTTIVEGLVTSETEAFVTACYFDQAATFDIDTDELVNQSFYTAEYRQRFVRESADGQWTADSSETLNRWDGEGGCASN